MIIHLFKKALEQPLNLCSGILILSLFTSCEHMADFGPVNLAKIQEAQNNGQGSGEYRIVDINSQNLRKYNSQERSSTFDTPPYDSSLSYQDEILPYDQLSLQVVDTAQTGALGSAGGPTTFGPVEVPKNGTISFPYAGEFQVIGKSLQDLQREIKSAYENSFNTAEVSLSRVSRKEKRANVIGLVKGAGQFPLTREGITMADLIALSGGTKSEPHMCLYLLHRSGKTYQLSNLQITKRNLYVQDGDLLEVKLREDHSVTLMGAVQRPGNHHFPNSQSTLSDFLGSSSGLNLSTSNARGVFVIRNMTSKYTNIFRFDLKNPEGLINSSKFYLHGGDIVYVTEAPLSRWNRAIRNVLPLGSSVSGAATQAAGVGAIGN